MTNHRLDQIDCVSLDAVNGGRDYYGQYKGVRVGSSSTPREDCEAGVERRAWQRYPDSRWFWQRWTGTGTDTNADARAKMMEDNVRGTCGAPQ